MNEPDPRIERLINEFFASGCVLGEEAHVRWRAERELDPVTVLLIRSWSTNRALRAFELDVSDAQRSQLVADHHWLNRWLAAGRA
ncbi:hypothetical protein [Streptomyces sp. YGL11-2]|uniref:hypothetical protein n=1 Tax=Streptomyces sp. YGL11-2 TaxID=3414028 RepID=UPI003CED59F2